MIRFALKGLLTRKLRTALTAIAIVLGVATVSGTFVLTDSIDKAFDSIFSDVCKGTDATITGQVAVRHRGGLRHDRGRLRRVAARARCASCRTSPTPIGGVATENAQLVKDGKAIVFGGAPNLGFSVDPTRPEFSTLTLVEGAWPKANEVVDRQVDRGQEGPRRRLDDRRPGRGPGRDAADLGHRQVRLGQLDRRRDARGLRPPDGAAALRQGGQARPDPRRRQARRSPPRARLGDRGDPAADGAGPYRAARRRQEDAEGTDEFISFLRYFLLAFGVIALFVGAFVIVNSLSITIAQRTRELATLRTLGASRRQVRWSVVLEALVDGRRRLRGRAVPRARARQGPVLRCSTRSASRCRTRGFCSRRARSSSRSRSASSSR